MRRATGMIIGALVWMACVTTASAVEQRIVFVDLDEVFNEFYKTKEADLQLKESADKFNEERSELLDEYEALKVSFSDARAEAQNTALSESIRTEKRDEAEELLIDMRETESRIRRFEDSKKKQLEQQGKRMRERIVEEIQSVIDTYAAEMGYYAVIDDSGQSLNAVELILYTSPQVEITEEIITRLNKDE